MNLTSITKDIGNTIARIKQNNQLIDELNKQFANPTFLEILEDAKKTNSVLATMLMLWYKEKYFDGKNDEPSTIYDELIATLAEEKPKQKKKTKPHYVLESGCGNTSGWLYGGGCGSSDYMDDSGCGGSSSRGGC